MCVKLKPLHDRQNRESCHRRLPLKASHLRSVFAALHSGVHAFCSPGCKNRTETEKLLGRCAKRPSLLGLKLSERIADVGAE